MPFYPYRRRFNNRRRVNNRRLVRNFRRKWTRRGMGDKGRRFFKIRLELAVSTNAGGIMTLAATNNPSGASDWSSISALFDAYKVAAMKIKYIPSLPNDTSVTTGYAPFYMIADADSSTTPLASTTDAIQYENMQVKNMYRPWSFYYKFPKRTAVATGATVLQGGYQDIAAVGASGGLYGYGLGFDASTTYGQAIVTYYITVTNRR